MGANNRLFSLAGAGGGASLWKSPNARCLETSAKEVEGEKRQERLRHQQRKVGTPKAHRAEILLQGKDENGWHAQH